MPGRVNLGQGRGPFRPKAFFVPYRKPGLYVMNGITKDSTGAALGNCDVFMLETSTKILRDETRSDANGNYRVQGSVDVTYWILWYKSGAPDLAGCSVNTIVMVPG